eukprot:m.69568 g.69568  ORF g.69568 m.69568 type:complete len:50 (+) comp16030_c0_seq1:175-324(+)
MMNLLVNSSRCSFQPSTTPAMHRISLLLNTNRIKSHQNAIECDALQRNG